MYERGLSIHTQIGNPHGRATALTNLGSLLSRMKRRDEALEVLYAARKFFDELGVRSHGSDAVTDLIKRLGGEARARASEEVAPNDDASNEDVPDEDAPNDDGPGDAPSEETPPPKAGA